MMESFPTVTEMLATFGLAPVAEPGEMSWVYQAAGSSGLVATISIGVFEYWVGFTIELGGTEVARLECESVNSVTIRELAKGEVYPEIWIERTSGAPRLRVRLLPEPAIEVICRQSDEG